MPQYLPDHISQNTFIKYISHIIHSSLADIPKDYDLHMYFNTLIFILQFCSFECYFVIGKTMHIWFDYERYENKRFIF